MKKLKFIDLFCGIGGFRIAAERVFKKHNINSECVFSSDIDKYVQISYFSNFGIYPEGDLTKIPTGDIPNHDILFAGFPCQPFSIIGRGEGFKDTRGTLFFDIARILDAKKPKAFVLENVKQLVSHCNGITMNKILSMLRELDYFVDWRILNALDYGLPQKRERVLILGYHRKINFQWPPKQDKIIPLKQILEKNVEEKHYASRYIRDKRKLRHTPSVTPSIWHENKSGNISSYPYSCALRAGASYNYLLVDGERRLTPREMLRLQGFPDWFKIAVPDTQIRKQAGNAVPVNMVAAVLTSLMPFIEKDFFQQTNLTPEFYNARIPIPAFANS